MSAIPKREQDLIATALSGIWNQPTKEQALAELDEVRMYITLLHGLNSEYDSLFRAMGEYSTAC
jgi:hypothetical protein